MSPEELADAESLAASIAKDYAHARALPDGSVAAIGGLIFTTAIYLGCTREGWSKRFCFDDRQRALLEYAKLTSEDDVPSGWIARRQG